MSASQKRFVKSLRRGNYSRFIFGEADHLPIEHASAGEYIIHTESPRFMARIEPNELACDTERAVTAPLVSAIYGMGDDCFIAVGWDAGDVASIEFRCIVNLDDAPLDLAKVAAALIEATRLWIDLTVEANNG